MSDALVIFLLVCAGLVVLAVIAFLMVLAVGLGIMAAEGVGSLFRTRKKRRRGVQ